MKLDDPALTRSPRRFPLSRDFSPRRPFDARDRHSRGWVVTQNAPGKNHRSGTATAGALIRSAHDARGTSATGTKRQCA